MVRAGGPQRGPRCHLWRHRLGDGQQRAFVRWPRHIHVGVDRVVDPTVLRTPVVMLSEHAFSYSDFLHTSPGCPFPGNAGDIRSPA